MKYLSFPYQPNGDEQFHLSTPVAAGMMEPGNSKPKLSLEEDRCWEGKFPYGIVSPFTWGREKAAYGF